MGSSDKQNDVSSVSQRLTKTTAELQELEKLIVAGNFSPRVLAEFRTAVDDVRRTAWVVQEWIGLQDRNRDPYAVLGKLSSERVRRATQMAKDLTIDVQSLEVDFATEGLVDLFRAIEDLRECLAPLFNASDRR